MKKMTVLLLILVSLVSCNFNNENSNIEKVNVLESWPNGKIKSEKQYLEDTINYKILRYFENGKKHSAITYRGGNLNGVCMEWYINGVTADSSIYTNGKLLYKKERYENGIIEKEFMELSLDSVTTYDSLGGFVSTEKNLFGNMNYYSKEGDLIETTKIRNDTMFFYEKNIDKKLVLVSYRVKYQPLTPIATLKK